MNPYAGQRPARSTISGSNDGLPPVFGGFDKTKAGRNSSAGSGGISSLMKGILCMGGLMVAVMMLLFYSVHVPSPKLTSNVASAIANVAPVAVATVEMRPFISVPPDPSISQLHKEAAHTEAKVAIKAHIQAKAQAQATADADAEAASSRGAVDLRSSNPDPDESATDTNAEANANKAESNETSEESKAVEIIERIRELKYTKKVVIESSDEAQALVAQAQQHLRAHLHQLYGDGPIYVQMAMTLPAHLLKHDGDPAAPAGNGKRIITIKMAPIEHVPYSVYFFLREIVRTFDSGDFHRKAGHVLQAMLRRDRAISGPGNAPRFAWQEYSPQYPHKQWTMGYAGRPSSASAMYISRLDNTQNHGPASQGSKTEADCIIGELADAASIAVAKEMGRQEGGSGGNGFVKDNANYIHIDSLRVLAAGEYPQE